MSKCKQISPYLMVSNSDQNTSINLCNKVTPNFIFYVIEQRQNSMIEVKRAFDQNLPFGSQCNVNSLNEFLLDFCAIDARRVTAIYIANPTKVRIIKENIMPLAYTIQGRQRQPGPTAVPKSAIPPPRIDPF